VRFYARRTKALENLLACMAFEMSAEGTSRVCQKAKIPVSPDSILRLVRKTKVDHDVFVRVLGVDDWAFRKGQNYGTILVDLERNQTIELLPDRTQHTLSAWLRKHPEIEIVSRDRSFEYKAGIESGAPQATQVVDRWHLLHNLREKLQEVIPDLLKSRQSDAEKAKTPSYEKRRKYFEWVNYLHAKGYSQRAIAGALGISRGTVIHYIERSDVPDWQPGKAHPSQLDAYADHLRMCWEVGCRDITVLWKELQAMGFKGQRKGVARYLQRFKAGTPFRATHQLVWLFMKASTELEEEEHIHLEAALADSQKLQAIYQLVQNFCELISQKEPDKLDDWLDRAEKCDVKKLQNFAIGLRQDYDAVKAALSHSWSNGQVEGQVNRLKTIKHQMYGRASFDLLRQRVLGPP
jgi:transposase